MPRPRRVRPDRQLSLRLPEPGQPTWWSLPPEVRQRTLTLLAHLLGQYQAPHRPKTTAQEVDDQ